MASMPASLRLKWTSPASRPMKTIFIPWACRTRQCARAATGCAALKNCGYDIPPTHITINLAPADIRKEGSGFDLPMAVGILGAHGCLNKKEVPDGLFVGELSLRWRHSGRARRVAHRHRGPR